MASRTSTPTCEAIVTYKKQLGKLHLTSSALRWIPKDGLGSAQIGPINIDLIRLQGLFSSKDGAEKALLKICATPKNPTPAPNGPSSNPSPDEVYSFNFTSPTSANDDKETFKHHISQVISQIRSQAQQQGAINPAEVQQGKTNSEKQNVNTNPENGKATIDPLQNWKLKKKVLQKDPNLRQLHKEMVIGGQISEGEFWDGREELLYHEARLESQKSGRSAQMVDPRPETVDGGEIRISITPQMIRDIFEQYPVVQKIYNENVPPLNDQTFWTRYFRSKLFNRHRSSARQTGDAVKDDDIFDKYLDDDDDGIEPKHINTREVFKLIDLAATQEDHVETGNANDWTMRAGTQRSSLPLMRRFNEHSARLLESSLGKVLQQRRAGVINGGDAGSRNYYENTDLEDLHEEKEPERIVLDMQERERYFEGSSAQPTANNASNSVKRKRTVEEDEEIVHRVANRITNRWNFNLGKFKVHREDVNQATRLMLDNISVRSGQNRGFDEGSMPKDFFNQMVSTYTTTNEFLRQFWSSILPNPTMATLTTNANIEINTEEVIIKKKELTAEEKALKAQRMMNFLNNTNTRIDFLLNNSALHLDPFNKSIVIDAFLSLRNSVVTAQNYYIQRTS